MNDAPAALCCWLCALGLFSASLPPSLSPLKSTLTSEVKGSSCAAQAPMLWKATRCAARSPRPCTHHVGVACHDVQGYSPQGACTNRPGMDLRPKDIYKSAEGDTIGWDTASCRLQTRSPCMWVQYDCQGRTDNGRFTAVSTSLTSSLPEDGVLSRSSSS